MGRGLGVIAIAFAALGACNALNGSGDLTIDGDAGGGGVVVEGGADGGPTPPGAPPPLPPPVPPGADAGSDADAGAPACDPSDPSLVLCFPFDNDALDHAAAPATVQTQKITLVPGRVGNAGSFDGVSSLLTMSPPPAKVDAIASEVTIEAFVSPAALPVASARMGIFDCDGRFGLFVLSTGVECVGNAGNVTGPTLAAGAVTHVACTIGVTTITLYYDGAAVATGTTSAILGPSHPVAIGMNSPSGDVLIGTLDEVRLYSRVKTTAEILGDAKR